MLGIIRSGIENKAEGTILLLCKNMGAAVADASQKECGGVQKGIGMGSYICQGNEAAAF